MQSAEIRKAMTLLREAQQLLRGSKVANLRKSAEYLSESLQVLQRHDG